MFKKGYKQTVEQKRKIGEANKIALLGKHCSPKTEFKKGHTSPMYWLGKKQPVKMIAKRIAPLKGRRHGFDAIAITDKRIKEEMIELEKQGFRCVPVGGKVRPDIIGIKDGKVFAIEVEYRKSPNYSKYDGDNRKYFDDIMWINRHKYPNNNNN